MKVDLLELDKLIARYHRENSSHEFLGYRFLIENRIVIYSEEICRVYGKVTVHSETIKLEDLGICTTQE